MTTGSARSILVIARSTWLLTVVVAVLDRSHQRAERSREMMAGGYRAHA
ncbi:MAG: hypothetical protein ACK54R_04780 [Pirellulaceae bacterium]